MSDFKIPENLEGLSLDELTALATDARAAGAELGKKADDEFTDADLALADELLTFIASVDAAITESEAAAEARTDKLNSLRSATAPKDEAPAKDEDKAPAEKEDAEAKAAAEATPAEQEKEPAVAAARKSVAAEAAAAITTPADLGEETVGAKATIVAAANLPGGQSGDLTMREVAEIAIDRFKRMPKEGTLAPGSYQQFSVAQIHKGRNDGLVVPEGASQDTIFELVKEAGNEKRLTGGSLTAAAGWCAPSETVYDLCANESTDGIWDIPELQVRRGGLNFTKGPDFSDIYALGGFDLTEAEVEAGTEKTCWAVPCPDFTDVRLDAVGICITAGLLQRAAYPEIVDRYLQGGVIAHQHRIAAKLIADANTVAGAALSLTNVFPNALSLLHALELVAEGERQRYRLPFGATLEVVLPRWIRPALRADLANRTGVELTNVTDAQLNAHFTNRGLRVQFVYNYQPLTLTSNVAADYPSTLEALIYPAGTFTKLTDDVISLSTVYDSTNLKVNAYTALFFEEGVALANTCWAPRRISLPLSVSGLTAAANINQDWRAAGPLNAVPIITVTA